jgi:hypothetical protein
MCETAGAFNSAVWAGGTRTKIFAIDAGFGGDPCECMYIEFGEDVTGREVIEFSPTIMIPIQVGLKLTPEDQIAHAVKGHCSRLNVPDENVFFDCGMRATLAISLARIMSANVNAVNFGGPATDRPVNEDTFYTDPKTQERRLVKCVEEYSKFVTELHYSVRELVEAKQARSLPMDVAEEFAMREGRWVPGPIGMRKELETKIEFKQRMSGQSPNKSDACSISVEGARRLGFKIKNLKEERGDQKDEEGWLERELQKHRKFVRASELSYK